MVGQRRTVGVLLFQAVKQHCRGVAIHHPKAGSIGKTKNALFIMECKETDPWFVAVDVCAILDITNRRMAIDRFDPGEKGVSSMDTP